MYQDVQCVYVCMYVCMYVCVCVVPEVIIMYINPKVICPQRIDYQRIVR